MFFDYDSRAMLLTQKIENSWKKEVKELHKKNKEQIKQSLIFYYGSSNAEMKLCNFIALGTKPVSILAFHSKFVNQIRNAFVIGAYYPALTATCTLGERILNHLIVLLRKDFSNTTEYKKVYNKKSFDNWNLAINTLKSWGVFTPTTVKSFEKLSEFRKQAIHFRPEIDLNDRSIALEAIRCLNEIINEQFTAWSCQPWFITGVPGEIYIKKEAEKDPFIQKVYIPNCHLVGPRHSVVSARSKFTVNDNYEYEDKEISDAEFVKLRKSLKAPQKVTSNPF